MDFAQLGSSGGNTLVPGDVVAFLDAAGHAYVAIPPSDESEPTWFMSEPIDALQEPRCHLVVHRGPSGELGFKSADAGNRFLQPRRRGRARLALAGQTFGVNEQWVVDGGESPIPPSSPVRSRDGGSNQMQWASAPLLSLRSRRYPEFKLAVKVLRVPASQLTSATAAASANAQFEQERGSSPIPVRRRSEISVPRSVRASAQGALGHSMSPDRESVELPQDSEAFERMSASAPSHARDAAQAEQGSVMSAMSGLLVREWSSFVLKEVRARQKVDGELKDLGEQLRKCQQDTLKEIDSIKLMMHEECQRTLLEAWRRQERMRLLRARRRLKSSVLRGWHLVIRDRVMKRERARSAHSAGMMQRAMSAWRWYVDETKENRKLVIFVRRRANFERASTTFSAWFQFTRLRLIRARGLRSILARALGRILTSFFAEWQQAARNAAWVRRRMAGAFCKHVRCMRRYAFQAWTGEFDRLRKFRTRYAKSCRVRQRKILREGFGAFRRTIIDNRRKRHHARRFLYLASTRRVGVLMQEWREHVRWTKRYRSRARRAMLMFSQRTSAIVMQEWRDVARRTARNRTKLRKFLYFTAQRGLNIVLQEWHEVTHGKHVYAHRVRKHRALLRRRCMDFGMEAFRRLLRMASHRRHQTRKFMFMMSTRQQAVVMQEWREQVNWMKKYRSRGRQAMLRMSQRTSAIVMQEWRDVATRTARNRTKLRKFLYFTVQRGLNIVLQEWHEATHGKRVYAQRVRKHRALLRRRCMENGMEAFRRLLRMAKHRKSQLRRMLFHASTRQQAVVMQEWREQVNWMKKYRSRGRRAMLRMSQRTSAIVMQEWRDVARRTARNRTKLRKFLYFTAQRGLNIVLQEWHEVTHGKHVYAHRVRKHRALLRRRCMDFGMEAFRRLLRMASHRRHQTRKFMFMMSTRQQAVVMQEWREQVNWMKKYRSRGRHAMLRMSQRTSAIVMQEWRDVARRTARNRTKLRKFLYFTAQRGLNIVLQEWHEVTHGKHVYAQRVRKHRALLRRRCMDFGMEAFRRLLRMASHRRHQTRKFMFMMSTRQQAVVMQEWREQVNWMKKYRSRGRQAMLRMSQRASAIVMQEWRELARRGAAIRRKTRKFLFLMGCRIVEVAMREWRIAASRSVVRRRKISKSIYRMSSRKSGFILQQWFSAVITERMHRNRILRMYRRRLQMVLTVWKYMATGTSGMKKLVNIKVRFFTRIRNRSILYAWRDVKDHSVYTRRLLLKQFASKTGQDHRNIQDSLVSERVEKFEKVATQAAEERLESIAEVQEAKLVHANAMADSFVKAFVSTNTDATTNLARAVAQAIPSDSLAGVALSVDDLAEDDSASNITATIRQVGRLELSELSRRAVVSDHLESVKSDTYAVAARLVDPRLLLKAGLNPTEVDVSSTGGRIRTSASPSRPGTSSRPSRMDFAETAREEAKTLREELTLDIDAAKMKIKSLESKSKPPTPGALTAGRSTSDEISIWRKKLEIAQKRLNQLEKSVQMINESKYLSSMVTTSTSPEEADDNSSKAARSPSTPAMAPTRSAVSLLTRRFEQAEPSPQVGASRSMVSPSLASARESVAAARAVAVQRDESSIAQDVQSVTDREKRKSILASAQDVLENVRISRNSDVAAMQPSVEILLTQVSRVAAVSDECSNMAESAIPQGIARHAALAKKLATAMVRNDTADVFGYESEMLAIEKSLEAMGDPVLKDSDEESTDENSSLPASAEAHECVQRLVALAAACGKARDEAEAAAAAAAREDSENSGDGNVGPLDPESAARWMKIRDEMAQAELKIRERLDRLISAREKVANVRATSANVLRSTLVSIDPVVHDRALAAKVNHNQIEKPHVMYENSQNQKAMIEIWRNLESMCKGNKALARSAMKDVTSEAEIAARSSAERKEQLKVHASELLRKGLTKAYGRAVSDLRRVEAAKDRSEALAASVAANRLPEVVISGSREEINANVGTISSYACSASDAKELIEKSLVGTLALMRDLERREELVVSGESDELSLDEGIVAKESMHVKAGKMTSAHYAQTRALAALVALRGRKAHLTSERSRLRTLIKELREKMSSDGLSSDGEKRSSLHRSVEKAENELAKVEEEIDVTQEHITEIKTISKDALDVRLKYELGISEHINRFAELSVAKTTESELTELSEIHAEGLEEMQQLLEQEQSFAQLGRVDKEEEIRERRVALRHKLDRIGGATELFSVNMDAARGLRMNIVRLEKEKACLQKAIELQHKGASISGSTGEKAPGLSRSPTIAGAVSDLERDLSSVSDAISNSETHLNEVMMARDQLRRSVAERALNILDKCSADVSSVKQMKERLTNKIAAASPDENWSASDRDELAEAAVEFNRKSLALSSDLRDVWKIAESLIQERDHHHEREDMHRKALEAPRAMGDEIAMKVHEVHCNDHANEARAFHVQYESIAEKLRVMWAARSEYLQDFEKTVVAKLDSLDKRQEASKASNSIAMDPPVGMKRGELLLKVAEQAEQSPSSSPPTSSRGEFDFFSADDTPATATTRQLTETVTDTSMKKMNSELKRARRSLAQARTAQIAAPTSSAANASLERQLAAVRSELTQALHMRLVASESASVSPPASAELDREITKMRREFAESLQAQAEASADSAAERAQIEREAAAVRRETVESLRLQASASTDPAKSAELKREIASLRAEMAAQVQSKSDVALTPINTSGMKDVATKLSQMRHDLARARTAQIAAPTSSAVNASLERQLAAVRSELTQALHMRLVASESASVSPPASAELDREITKMRREFAESLQAQAEASADSAAERAQIEREAAAVRRETVESLRLQASASTDPAESAELKREIASLRAEMAAQVQSTISALARPQKVTFGATDQEAPSERRLERTFSNAGTKLRNLLASQREQVRTALDSIVHARQVQSREEVEYVIERSEREKEIQMASKLASELERQNNAAMEAAASLAQLDAIRTIRLQRVADSGGDETQVAAALTCLAAPTATSSVGTPATGTKARLPRPTMVSQSPTEVVHAKTILGDAQLASDSAAAKELSTLLEALASQAKAYEEQAIEARASGNEDRAAECMSKSAECKAASESASYNLRVYRDRAHDIQSRNIEKKVRAVAHLEKVLEQQTSNANATQAAADLVSVLGESRDALNELSDQMHAVKVLADKEKKLQKMHDHCMELDDMEKAALLNDQSLFIAREVAMKLLGGTGRKKLLRGKSLTLTLADPMAGSARETTPKSHAGEGLSQRVSTKSTLNLKVHKSWRENIMRKAVDAWHIVHMRRVYMATRIGHYRLVLTRVRGPFRGWFFVQQAHARKKQILVKVHRRMMQLRLRSHIKAWHEVMQEARRKEAWRNGMLENSKRRSRWICLKASFATWKSKAQRRKHLLAIGRRAVLAAKHALVRRAFLTMRHAARSRLNLRVLAAKCLTRVLTNLAWTFFSSWKAYAHMVVQNRSLVRMALARLAAKTATVSFVAWHNHIEMVGYYAQRKKRALAMWTNRLSSDAFHGWRMEREEQRRLGMRLRRSARKIMTVYASAAFHDWVDAVSAKNAMRGRVRCVIARMLRFCALRALNAWMDVALNRRKHFDLLERVARVRMSLMRWNAFARWREAMLVRKEKNRLVRMAIMRILRSKLSACFRHWLLCAQNRLLMDRKVHEAARRFLLGNMYTSFYHWRDVARHAVTRDRLMRAFRVGCAKNLAKIYLRGWYRTSSLRSALLRQYRHAWLRLSMRLMRTVLRHWLTAAYAQQRARDSITAISRKHMRMVQHKFTKAWAGEMRTARANRTRAFAAFARMRRALLRQVVLRWHRVILHEQKVRQTLARFASHLLNLWGSAVLRSWWKLGETVRLRKEKMHRCVTAKRVVMQWFLQWYWDAYDDEIRSALRLLYGSTEGAMDSLYGNGGGQVSPVGLARIRGIGGGGYTVRRQAATPSETSSVGAGLEEAAERAHVKFLRSSHDASLYKENGEGTSLFSARYGNAAAAAAAAASKGGQSSTPLSTPSSTLRRSGGGGGGGGQQVSPDWGDLTNRLNI